MLAYFVAFLAAVSNAAANVLQRIANKREPPTDRQFSWAMIRDLLKQPVWLAGIAFTTLSFLLQSCALGIGTLATIQPLIMLELPLTLLAAAIFMKSRLGRQEWLSIFIMTAGIIALIASLAPEAGNYPAIPASVWLMATAASVGLVLALYLASFKVPKPNHKAVLLGTATGVAFGVTAALIKGMTVKFEEYGLVGALTSWQLWGAVAAGIIAMWLYQNAIHFGRLVAAQPGVTIADPCVSILWGALVFNEQMRGGVFIIPAVISTAALAAGAIMLARSDALAG